MEQLRTCIILGMLTMLFGEAHCVETVADIVFLVDSSGSLGNDNFTKQKQFIANFAQSITIGPQNSQIGVVTFSRSVRNEFDLSTHHDVSSLVNAIDAIEWMGRSTNTDLGLQYVMQNSFTTAAGDRPNARNILIVMTDGKSRQPNLTIAAAVELHQMSITVFAIGIGSGVDREELRRIASSAENEFLVDDFDALETIQAKLKTSVFADKCFVHGDPHIETLDKLIYKVHVDVPCNYYLVQHSSFSVIGRLTACNKQRNKPLTRISCLDKIQIDFKGYTYILEQGGDVTDELGNSLPMPVNLTSVIEIKDSGNVIEAELSNGILVVWNKKKNAEILVLKSFMNTIDGLCGNYDGDASNDVDHQTRNNQNQYKVDSSCPATK